MNSPANSMLLVATLVAGLSGWGAIFAWWFRERSKTVRGIKILRRTNARLQKTVMFTLEKWRDQVRNNQAFLLIEREYAERLAASDGRSADEIKTAIRAEINAMFERHDAFSRERPTPDETRHQLAAIDDVERYVATGKTSIAELQIEEGVRRAA